MSYSSLPTSKLFQLTALTLSLALAGCGGSGGTDTIAPEPDLGVTIGTDDGGVGSGDIGDVLNVSTISLLDTNANITRVVSMSGVTAQVVVTDSEGNGVSGALVTFSGDGVQFGTSNGAVLTNADGVATTSVVPLSSTDTGSYSLSATATYDDVSVTTASYNYSLQAVNITLVNFATGENTLESGGSTIVTLQTKDTVTDQFQNDVTVNLTSTCGSFENASITSSNQGNVSATYSSIDSNGNLCEGLQTITAVSASNTSSSQSVNVNIKSIEASSIVYTTTNSVVLGAKNSGSSSSSQIEFTVYANGVPAANQDVTLDLIKSPSDFNFVSQGNRDSKPLKSNSLGKVTVNLYPGNIPGPVEIQASLQSNANTFALAKNISVATGRPTQNGVTLAIGKNVLADNAIDSTNISAYLTDRQGNFVPDGTVVSFVAEGGTVTPNCATVSGNCTVTFTSQNPRPANGRVSVIAYVEGDKAYSDLNGDNVYTVGIDDLLDNIGNFFRDDNEDLKYTPGEFVYKRGEQQGGDQATCAAATLSQPNLPNFIVGDDTDATQCDNLLPTVLRKQVIMGFANDTPTFYNYSQVSGFVSFEMYGNSVRTVSMPSGTALSLTVKDNTDNGATCESEIASGNITVPNLVNLNRVDSAANQNYFDGSSEVRYTVSTTGCAAGDSIKLSVATPSPTSKTTTVQIF
ncbi:Ig-like domain-containing protein [Psychrobacter sp. NG254]|uniref:Ig-like domain-containing protein n=1 Tax=Psychrobacter sp. NG254 TaxID=2782003 RepID=UPI001886BE50|nr:Ig-like domain-containing protein [Psychrobacter sp. NG254]MBF2720295.1 Ig-like domain-containing protein [Psychrobacter sp. NG254]